MVRGQRVGVSEPSTTAGKVCDGSPMSTRLPLLSAETWATSCPHGKIHPKLGNLMTSALLLLIYSDFLGGALEVPNGNEVIPIANAMMERFDTVIATQDWHPARHGSFASTHDKPQRSDRSTWSTQVLVRSLCARDSRC